MPGPLPYNPDSEVLARGRDGSLRAVPKADIAQLEASGGQVLSAEQAQAALAEKARRDEAESFGGQARTLAGSAASGVLSPFAALAGGTGEQAAAGLLGGIDAATGGQDTTLENYAIMRRDAEVNPTLQMLGSTVGTTATAMLGGTGIGMAGGRLATALGSDALATTLANGGTLSQLAGKAVAAAPGAVGTAAENALGGIGAANEQAFLENRELAADEVAGAGLVGAGLGMGIGLGARGLGKAASAAGQAVARAVPEGALSSLAEKAAFRDLANGASKTAFKDIMGEGAEEAAKRIGRRQLDEGLVGMGSTEALESVKGKLAEKGALYEKIGQDAAEHVDNAWLYEKVSQQVDNLKARAGTGSAEKLANDVATELDPLFARMKNGEQISFDDLMKARTQVREGAAGLKGVQKRAFKELERTLTDSLDEAVKRADDAAGSGGKMLESWKSLNKDYSDLSTIRKAYASKVAKEQSDRVFSFGEQHSGGQAALLGSLMTGNIGTGALLGMGTAAARKLVREKGAGWLARAADALAQRGEVPSVTRMLALSSQARQQLGKYAVGQLVQQGARRIASEEAPAGFAFGALANYSDPKQVSDQYTHVIGQLRASDGDIEGMASRANEHLGALAQEQPELAAAAQMKMANAIGYLRDNMPPEAPVSVLAMQAGTQSKRLPPSNDQVSFLKRYRATVDPSVIYGEIARGHVNPETVQTLQTLYPAYLASVQMGTLESLNALQPGELAKLPYSKRLALDTLMGGNGQVEPTRRFTVQDRLAQANAEAMQGSGPQTPASHKAPDIAKFGVTTSARLMST